MASRVVDAAASADTGSPELVSTADAQDPLKSRRTVKIVPDIVYVPDKDFYLWEVVRASTAAPTYFPGDAELASQVLLRHVRLSPPNPMPWQWCYHFAPSQYRSALQATPSMQYWCQLATHTLLSWKVVQDN